MMTLFLEMEEAVGPWIAVGMRAGRVTRARIFSKSWGEIPTWQLCEDRSQREIKKGLRSEPLSKDV